MIRPGKPAGHDACESVGQVEPAVLAADGLVYAPEIKYYACQVPVDQTTDIAGLYVTGNATPDQDGHLALCPAQRGWPGRFPNPHTRASEASPASAF